MRTFYMLPVRTIQNISKETISLTESKNVLRLNVKTRISIYNVMQKYIRLLVQYSVHVS